MKCVGNEQKDLNVHVVNFRFVIIALVPYMIFFPRNTRELHAISLKRNNT